MNDGEEGAATGWLIVGLFFGKYLLLPSLSFPRWLARQYYFPGAVVPCFTKSWFSIVELDLVVSFFQCLFYRLPHCLVPLVVFHLFIIHPEPWFTEIGQRLQFGEDSFQILSPGKQVQDSVRERGVLVKWWAWNNPEVRGHCCTALVTGASPLCPLLSCQTFCHTSQLWEWQILNIGLGLKEIGFRKKESSLWHAKVVSQLVLIFLSLGRRLCMCTLLWNWRERRNNWALRYQERGL